MKTLKIRFVERTTLYGSKETDYLIQRKTLFGWSYYGYWQSGGFGDSVWYLYCENQKDILLKKIINDIYKTEKKYISIVEYPMLKTY